MAPKILFVAKDLGATSVTLPVAEIARDCEWEVGVVTEGLAGPKFIAEKFEPAFMGTRDFEKVPFAFDVYSFLKDYFPDDSTPSFVIIGESSPINLEVKMAQEMEVLNRDRRNQIMLVECQDFWRGHSKMDKIIADLYLPLDNFGQKIVMEDKRIPKERAVIVGNPGAKDVEVTSAVKKECGLLKQEYECVFYFAGGRPDTMKDEMDLLAGCFRKMEGKQILVVGHHPKYVDETRELVSLLPENVTVKEAEPGTASQWASLMVTIAGFSTALTTAAYYSRTAIALETSATMRSLREQAGLEKIPQVELGYAQGVKKPVDLYDLIGCLQDKPEPYSPQTAFEAIKSMI